MKCIEGGGHITLHGLLPAASRLLLLIQITRLL